MRHPWVVLLPAVLALALSGGLAAATAAPAADFVVLSSADSEDGDPGDGDCDPNDDGSEEDCTLRAAIRESNFHEPGEGEGPNTISFGVAVTAEPATELPDVTQRTEISTTSESECNGVPGTVVSIDGGGAVPVGLVLVAPESAVCGLTIGGFFQTGVIAVGEQTAVVGSRVGTNTKGTVENENGIGIEVAGDEVRLDRDQISGNAISGVSIASTAEGTTITRSIIGADLTGSVALHNPTGIRVLGGSGARIGLPGVGNTISGNTNGIVLGDAAETLIQGNRIGTNGAGNIALPNTQVGVDVGGDGTHTIGGAVSAGGQATELCDDVCNVISGNGVAGVSADGGPEGETHLTIAGNHIGVNRAGTEPLGQGSGVRLREEARGVEVGGTEPGEENLIGGNTTGVRMEGEGTSENAVRGNTIGLARDGETTIPNTQSGVTISAGAGPNTVGGASAAARNLISANGLYGVFASAAGPGNEVEGNYIGTDPTGAAARPNGSAGVQVTGGTTELTLGGKAAGAGNVISGNAAVGVQIDNSDSVHVEGNHLGPNAAGTASLTEQNYGVRIIEGSENEIGGTTAGARNVISGNETEGVRLEDSDSNLIAGNYIGLQSDGETPLANTFTGISLAEPAESNTIGGAAEGAGNVISGNGTEGIRLEGADSNLIAGNYIGTDSTGLLDRGNSGSGIVENGDENEIGVAVAGNVIGGNAVGVGLGAASTSATIEGNAIGLGADGDTVIGNDGAGVSAGISEEATIGGAAEGAGNVISGNGTRGIESNAADELRILGNLIGSDAQGDSDRGNGMAGLFLVNTSDVEVGGTAEGAGNVISGNDGDGLTLFGAGGSAGTVEGNLVGLAADAATPLGNEGTGITVVEAASEMTIGGTVAGAGNSIASNGDDGVRVTGTGFDNRILGNSIDDNGEGATDLGIDLEGSDGVDANDEDDVDLAFPNRLQNYPVLTHAESMPGETNVVGTLNSEASRNYRVEIFAGDSCDPSGHGEGGTLIHAATVHTDSGGDVDFDLDFAGASPGRFATATATDLAAELADGTSEFSACLPIPPDTAIDSGPSGPTADDTPTFGLSSDYGAATFECRVDAAAFAACDAAHTTAALADGAHTFEARASAGGGNHDPTPAERAFAVDTTPPDTAIDSGPSGPTADSTPSFAFSTTEPEATFECRVDGEGGFEVCVSSHTTAALADGAHTFEVRALDTLGNADASPAQRAFTVDTTPPDTAIDSGPAGATADATPTFAFSSADPEATFECRVDAAPFVACVTGHTTATLADGAHAFQARASDPLGNEDPTPAERVFTVDTTPPETTIVSGPSGGTADATPTFAFVADDPAATFECRLAGGAFVPCLSPYTLSALPDGSYVFEARAGDEVGNIDGSPAATAFAVDTSTAAILSAPSGGQAAKSKPAAGTAVILGRAATVRGRLVVLKIRCAGTAGATCSGRVKLSARLGKARGARLLKSKKKGRRRSIVLGRGRFSLSAGRTQRLRLRITKRAARLIGARGRRGLAVTASGPGVRSRGLKLKRAPSKHKHKRHT